MEVLILTHYYAAQDDDVTAERKKVASANTTGDHVVVINDLVKVRLMQFSFLYCISLMVTDLFSFRSTLPIFLVIASDLQKLLLQVSTW